MNDPRCVTWPYHYIQSVTMSFEESCSAVPNMLLSNAAQIFRAVAFHSHLAPPHPCAFIGGKALPLLSVQPNELRHALNFSTSTFVSNLVFFGAICILVVTAVCRAMHVMRRFRASKLSHHTSFRRLHRSIFVSAITAFLFCASCIHSVAAADTAVVVDPSKGQDVSDCGLSDLAPCLTIHYALRTRRATSVLLSEGTFNEIGIYVESIAPFFSVYGLRNSTVFDCGHRGPAFIIANTSVTIAGVTFQNCVNLNASGTGGAISAHSNSVITVTNCAFYSNTAQTGGAIGAISSTLFVTSSLFENNTATCPNASAACAAWGGAIGAVEAPSVIIKNNNFNRNAVNLELNGVTDRAKSAAAGGGCVSVLYNADVTDSRVTMDGNTFHSCSVRIMSGSRTSTETLGVQYGNAYGGAVSVYYGLRAASSLQVRNVASLFTNNICRSSVITSSVGAGGSVYGGCLSVNAGAWSVIASGSSSVGSLYVENMRTNVSGNRLENCGAFSFFLGSNGANVYGGGVSVAVGAYSYGRGGSSSVSGNTTVSSSSYTISSNTLTNCTASSTTTSSPSSSTSISSGANVYGGGISVAVGAYSYSNGFHSTISGDTTVSSSSYTISSNTLTNCMTNCTASSSPPSSSLSSGSSTTSFGANVYGGGISVAVGAYSYGRVGFSTISGDTTVSSSSYTISSNTLTNCTASSTTTSSSSFFSFSSSPIYSYGANVYGGGISVAVGAYSYSYGGGGFSTISGDTTVSSSYTISSNTLTNCTASSTTTSSSSSSSIYSFGANVYGGGVSVAVGAYSLNSVSSTISGDTTVSSSSYTISSNTLTNCTASSTTTSSSSFSSFSSNPIYSYGANVYGGGISVAVGAYSYSYGRVGFSTISGDTTVNSSSYTISSNTLTNCTASSTTTSSSSSYNSSSPSSFGANVYGGGISVAVGTYLYGVNTGIVVSSAFISSCIIKFINVSCAHCSSISSGSGLSNEAFSFGGAVSTLFESYVYPKISRAFPAVTLSTSLTFLSCNFSQSIAFSSSQTCRPGGSSAAGGAMFASVVSTDVAISSSVFFHSRVRTGCAASSSQTFSLGGGVSIFRAGSVVLNETNFTYCRAIGVRQAINVLVGGGGIYVQDVESVTLESSFVTACSVEDAFSVRVLPCGGGAIGITNVSAVRISNFNVYDNSDSSLSGAILLQQLTAESDMVVNVTNGSFLASNPSISTALPVLNISCGSNCSVEQQQRMHLNVMSSTILAQNTSDEPYQSAAVMALPRWSMVSAANSHLRCNFSGVDSIAALALRDANRMSVTCAPCEKPFHIAMTSRSTMNLSKFSLFAAQLESRDSCRPLSSQSSGGQSCPYGISACSTVAYITVGFWASFAADGSVSDIIRCPSNYCGCRNIPGYNQPTCQLYPPFAEEYQPKDALCNGNRTGVLCGGCKQNFTQSLNGFSCVPNNVCSETRPLVWSVTVIGYIVYALYIVISSMTISSGLITCVLFYGQLSSFGSLPPQLFDASQTSFAASWFSKVTQFGSVMSLYDSACYGLDMGAYEATATQLSGPANVLTAALLLTAAGHWLLPKISHVLQKHDVEIRISLRVTIINVLLLLFSSVTSVVFQLITCQQVGAEKVVFIDGEKKCEGPLYGGMLAAAVVLSIFPVVFLLLLMFNKIPAATKSVVCSAYIESKYYWGAMSLIFRFLMTVLYATARDFPSITAFALLVSSVCMLVLLLTLRPYAQQRTHYMDLFCYVCLIVQYAFQVLVRTSESLGYAVVEANSFRPVLRNAAIASQVLRCACDFIHSSVSSVTIALAGTRRSSFARCSFFRKQHGVRS